MQTLSRASIQACIPDSTYDATVENILCDQKSGWRFDYYRCDEKSSYDVVLARAKAALEHQTLSKEKDVLLDKLTDLLGSQQDEHPLSGDWKYKIDQMRAHLDTLRREVEYTTNKEVKAAKHAEAEKLREEIKETRRSFVEAKEKDLRETKAKLSTVRAEISRLSQVVNGATFAPYTSYQDAVDAYTYKRFLEIHRRKHLQAIKETFREDGDEEFMKKAVTCVEKYIATLAKMSADTPPARQDTPPARNYESSALEQFDSASAWDRF